MRATTIRIAARKKTTIAILLGNDSKKEAQELGRKQQATGLLGVCEAPYPLRAGRKRDQPLWCHRTRAMRPSERLSARLAKQ